MSESDRVPFRTGDDIPIVPALVHVVGSFVRLSAASVLLVLWDENEDGDLDSGTLALAFAVFLFHEVGDSIGTLSVERVDGGLGVLFLRDSAASMGGL